MRMRAGMCQPSLRAILPSFASAQDRFTLLRDQASSACLVEPKRVLISPPTAQIKKHPVGCFLIWWAGVNPTNQLKPINKPFYESLKTLVPTNVPNKINL